MTDQLAFFAPAPGKVTDTEPSIEESFAIWWAAYPRKQSKGTARRAYAAARRRGVSAGDLLDGLQRYRFAPERRWQPLAATWLNGERYCDDPEPDPAADPYGLRAWLDAQRSLPAAGLFDPAGYDAAAYEEILSAAGFAATWRGSLDILGDWIREGYRPDSIAEVIAEAYARFGGVITSLRFFDRTVRNGALRWDSARHEWVRQRPQSNQQAR